MYTRTAKVIIVMYDITSPNSYPLTVHWYNKVKSCTPPDVLMALVGNKKDMIPTAIESKQITEEDLKWGPTFAEENNLIYLEVSCKTGENVNYCLYKIFSRVVMPQQIATAETEESSASLSGFLHKVPGIRGDNIGGWQERFFVCNASDMEHLYYYRSNRDYRIKKYAGKIKISEVKSVKLADDITQQSHSLTVVTPNRTWYFYAQKQEEQQKWLDFFCSICKANTPM